MWCGHRVGGCDHGAATSKWDGSGNRPKILLDVMKAQAAIAGQNLGYQADVLLISDTVWAYLAADSGLVALMARENLNNPVYTGRFQNLAGLDVVHVPAANMPGGDGTLAWVLDTTSLYQITVNQAFERVIRSCALPRSYADDTWISEDIIGGILSAV